MRRSVHKIEPNSLWSNHSQSAEAACDPLVFSGFILRLCSDSGLELAAGVQCSGAVRHPTSQLYSAKTKGRRAKYPMALCHGRCMVRAGYQNLAQPLRPPDKSRARLPEVLWRVHSALPHFNVLRITAIHLDMQLPTPYGHVVRYIRFAGQPIAIFPDVDPYDIAPT